MKNLIATNAKASKNKTTMEQLRLIQQLDDDDKPINFKMIDTILTKKKLKDFFQKNVAAF